MSTPAITPETLEAAVLAVSRHEWEPGAPWSSHAGHSQNASCQVCQGNIAAILTVAIPVLLSEHREQIREEVAREIEAHIIEDAPEWECSGVIEETLRYCADLARGSRLSDSGEAGNGDRS